MYNVWSVWADVDDYPEMGGGEFLLRLFRNLQDANTYAEQMAKEEEDENVHYVVKEEEVY